MLLRLRFVAFYHLLELGESTPHAIAVGEPLVGDLERLLGPDHPDTLNSRNSLAVAYLGAGRVAEAIPLFEQILAAVRQRMLGPDDSETLISQNNLASAYQDAGRTAEAIRLYELNLETRERLLGPDDPSTLNSRGNFAAAYRDGGRVGEAIRSSSELWPTGNECWAPITLIPESHGRNWPRPIRTRGGPPRRSIA